MATRGTATPRFPYKSDRLKPLRAFCQTVRLGSVSRAAEALFVSQPAVTLQLQALERELGVVLLERSGRRLIPSREGQLLYEMAQPLVESLDRLEADFREKARGLDAGELNIAANSSTILYLLPKIVENFRARHPDVRLTLHNAISADGTELLREDAVDLAVGSMLDVPADLSYAPVYRFDDLAPAQPIDGPAIVEYSGSTLFLPSGWNARIDERRNAHLTRASASRLSAEQSSSKETA
jgi:DNA-binding transcriptional LysR family regulator